MAGAKPEVGLIRSLRRWDLVAIVVNAVIGAGIFGLPSKIFSLVGVYSLFAFGICAICVIFVVLSFAEVASRFSESGGPYLYARTTFGPVTGFTVGWLVWMTRVTSFAANCNILLAYLAFFLPTAAASVPRVAIAAGIVLALVLLNVRGVRQAATASNFLTIGKLLPLAIFILVGLFLLNPTNFKLPALPGYAPFSNAVLLLVYAFSGFEMAVIPAGESRMPRENLPAALAIGIAVVVAVYVLIQIVCVGTLPGLATSQRPLADAAAHFAGYGGSVFIALGIVISVAGNLNVTLLSGSRVLFAMAEQKQLPQALAALHPRYRTPALAILFSGAVMLLLTLSGTFIYFLTISTLSRVIVYLITCGALPVLRRRKDAPTAVFTLPGGIAIAYAGVALCLWLLSNSSFKEARDTALAAAAGLVLFVVNRAALKARAVEAVP